MTDKPTNLPARLRSIADAGRRQDGTDTPLGEHLREAADEIERLREVRVLEHDQYDIIDKLTDLQNERDWAIEKMKKMRDGLKIIAETPGVRADESAEVAKQYIGVGTWR
jgi:hypothetical protein